MPDRKAISSDDIETQKRVDALFNPVPTSKADAVAYAVATAVFYPLINGAGGVRNPYAIGLVAFFLGVATVILAKDIWRLALKVRGFFQAFFQALRRSEWH